MLKAKKDNVTYKIREEDKERYIALGFDILNEKGKLVAAGSKAISAEETKALKERIAVVESDNLKMADSLSELENSNTELLKKLTVAQKENAKLKDEIEGLEAELKEIKAKAVQPPAQ